MHKFVQSGACALTLLAAILVSSSVDAGQHLHHSHSWFGVFLIVTLVAQGCACDSSWGLARSNITIFLSVCVQRCSCLGCIISRWKNTLPPQAGSSKIEMSASQGYSTVAVDEVEDENSHSRSHSAETIELPLEVSAAEAVSLPPWQCWSILHRCMTLVIAGFVIICLLTGLILMLGICHNDYWPNCASHFGFGLAFYGAIFFFFCISVLQVPCLIVLLPAVPVALQDRALCSFCVRRAFFRRQLVFVLSMRVLHQMNDWYLCMRLTPSFVFVTLRSFSSSH